MDPSKIDTIPPNSIQLRPEPNGGGNLRDAVDNEADHKHDGVLILKLPYVEAYAWLCVSYSDSVTPVASNPYALSIFWPSGDKMYIASRHASSDAPFLTKRP